MTREHTRQGHDLSHFLGTRVTREHTRLGCDLLPVTREHTRQGHDLSLGDERAHSARSRSPAGRRESTLGKVSIFRRVTRERTRQGLDLPPGDERASSARSRPSPGRPQIKFDQVVTLWWSTSDRFDRVAICHQPTSDQIRPGHDLVVVDFRSIRPGRDLVVVDFRSIRPGHDLVVVDFRSIRPGRDLLSCT